jgi:hypothetical protein
MSDRGRIVSWSSPRENAELPTTDPDPPRPAEIAGGAMAALAVEQLEVERASKNSLEHRGLIVVAASGLIASIASIAGRNADFPVVSVVFLVLSLCAFAGAAVLGILVALPRVYEEVDVADLGAWLERSSWEASGSLGLMRATQKRIELLRAFRVQNQAKAKLLTWAFWAEILGVLLLLVSPRSSSLRWRLNDDLMCPTCAQHRAWRSAAGLQWPSDLRFLGGR